MVYRVGAQAHTQEPGDRAGATLMRHAHAGVIRAKTEAAYNAPEPEDDERKIENGALTGALIGGGIGAVGGAIVGGVVGGGVGAAIGAGVGAAVGAGIGALIGLLVSGPSISWKPAAYTSDATNGSSTTVEQPFNVTYRAERDDANSVWRMRVDSIKGGADIHVRTGGSRNPISNPPTTEPEAQTAVTTMKGYYARGSRGAWHTEAASRKHEEHHYREWKCSGNHYWPATRTAIHTLTSPLASHPNAAAAVTAMRGGASGADAKIQAFRNIAHRYWFTLADNASSRPYAAGQRALNPAIRHVQGLAAGKGWTVDQGTDSPSPEPPCYQPWLAYSP